MKCTIFNTWRCSKLFKQRYVNPRRIWILSSLRIKCYKWNSLSGHLKKNIYTDLKAPFHNSDKVLILPEATNYHMHQALVYLIF